MANMSCDEMLEQFKSRYEECCTTLAKGEPVSSQSVMELYKRVYDMYTMPGDSTIVRKLVDYYHDVCMRHPTDKKTHDAIFAYLHRYPIDENGMNPWSFQSDMARTAPEPVIPRSIPPVMNPNQAVPRADPVELRINASFGNPRFEHAMNAPLDQLRGMFRNFSEQVRAFLHTQQSVVTPDTGRTKACIDKIAEAYAVAVQALAIPFAEKYPASAVQPGDEMVD